MTPQNYFSALLDSFNSVHNLWCFARQIYCLITSVDVTHCRFFWIVRCLSRECYAFRVLAPAFLDGRPANAGYGAVLDEMR